MAERRVFRTLLTLEDAKKKLFQHCPAQPVGVEEAVVRKALGRTIAEDIQCPTDVPSFDRASMDGFAVRANDTFGAEERRPVKLKIVGMIEAGETPQIEINAGEAVEISTGAPIPRGANAVVMVEHTERVEGLVDIFKAVNPGENIMAAGTDLMAGELALRRGQRLTPREMGILSAMGFKSVEVYRRPRVAVISTGNELVPPGSRLTYGKIHDINATVIAGAVQECGGEVTFEAVAKDTMDDLKEKTRKGLESADIVITSGSTSAGAGDLLYRILNSFGQPGIIVHGLAVKPGKPTVIAVANEKPIFGLPGYPTSVLMIFSLLVRPLISRMSGIHEDDQGKPLLAKCASKVFSTRGRQEFLPVDVIRDESGGFLAYPTTEGSGAITSLAVADGFVEVPEEVQFLDEGEKVEVKLFGTTLRLADLVIIGSHCIGLDILLECVRKTSPGFQAKIINVGSIGGLNAIKRGEADVAGIHLLDERSGEYNSPYLERYGLSNEAVMVKGYVRQQGLVVAKGNPKGLRGIEDLLRSNVTFMNRNRGSGTRILFDLCLKRIADGRKANTEELAARIRGYESEAKSHSAVAMAVLHGKADAGLAIRTVALMHDLEFIPIAEEHYDFIVLRRRLKKEAVKKLLDALKSDEFRTKLQMQAPGLVPSEETGQLTK